MLTSMYNLKNFIKKFAAHFKALTYSLENPELYRYLQIFSSQFPIRAEISITSILYTHWFRAVFENRQLRAIAIFRKIEQIHQRV